MNRRPTRAGNDRRYPALRFVGTAASIVGTLLAIGGAVLMIAGLITLLTFAAGARSGTFGPMVPLIWGAGMLVSGIQFLGLGALARLMIHLEENTRASAELLGQLVRARPGAEGAGGGPAFVS